MPAIKYEFKVEFEDGTELRVTADQRDVAEWEMQPFGTSGVELRARAYTAFRFLAFSALRRQGLIDKSMTWKRFSAECVEVSIDGRDDEDDEGEAVNPGQPVRRDVSSST